MFNVGVWMYSVQSIKVSMNSSFHEVLKDTGDLWPSYLSTMLYTSSPSILPKFKTLHDKIS